MKYIHLITLILWFGFISNNATAGTCQGRFTNPITDVCWSCLLPLSIGNSKIFKGKLPDTKNPSLPVCTCPGVTPVPRVGLSLGYWEPVFLVDVTRTPFCLVNLGGVQLPLGKWREGKVNRSDPLHSGSFYQVHWYVFPLMSWLNLLGDLACFEKSEFNIAYFSELDPTWNNDEWAFLSNPESVLFANHAAIAACATDAITISAGGLPIDSLFWCAGAQGSLYPLTGHVATHIGGVQASSLLTARINFKLHRRSKVFDSIGRNSPALCLTYSSPLLPKSRYRQQMTYPIAATKHPFAAKPVGHTTTTWEMGREFPYKGEDFGYLIWRKRNCCAGVG